MFWLNYFWSSAKKNKSSKSNLQNKVKIKVRNFWIRPNTNTMRSLILNLSTTRMLILKMHWTKLPKLRRREFKCIAPILYILILFLKIVPIFIFFFSRFGFEAKCNFAFISVRRRRSSWSSWQAFFFSRRPKSVWRKWTEQSCCIWLGNTFLQHFNGLCRPICKESIIWSRYSICRPANCLWRPIQGGYTFRHAHTPMSKENWHKKDNHSLAIRGLCSTKCSKICYDFFSFHETLVFF